MGIIGVNLCGFTIIAVDITCLLIREVAVIRLTHSEHLVRLLQSFHPLFLGNDYIGPAVDHFQEISARFPQVSPSIVWVGLYSNSSE